MSDFIEVAREGEIPAGRAGEDRVERGRVLGRLAPEDQEKS